MFLGLVLAIAAGLGTAFILNAADPTVRGSLDVVALAGAVPFAHVPTIRSQAEVRRRHLVNLALAGGIATIALVLLVLAA
jgi:hypothetical protein